MIPLILIILMSLSIQKKYLPFPQKNTEEERCYKETIVKNQVPIPTSQQFYAMKYKPNDTNGSYKQVTNNFLPLYPAQRTDIYKHYELLPFPYRLNNKQFYHDITQCIM